MTPQKPKIVCECLKVTEAQLLKAISRHEIESVADVISYTSAGDGCTACHPLLLDYLQKQRENRAATAPRPQCPTAPTDSSLNRSP